MSKPTKFQPGYRHGMLTVIRSFPVNGRYRYYACDVMCDCGNVKTVRRCAIGPSSLTTSCGCMTSKLRSANAKKHGETGTKYYNIWRGIIKRCTVPTHRAWKSYGGRGITVCERWLSSFENFRADMGPRPSPTHSLDRKDNNGNYEPGNCRWATAKEQLNNTRVNLVLEHNGVRMTAMQWAEKTGLAPHLVYARTRRGWSPERTLTTPAMSQYSHGAK